MDTPFRPGDGQRWLPFKNVWDKEIPAFAVIHFNNIKSKAVKNTNSAIMEVDGSWMLRGSSPLSSTVGELFQDAGAVFINSEFPVPPDGFGRCTQDYPAMALIRVDEDLRAGVFLGYGNSVDRSPGSGERNRAFETWALELGGGAFRFMGFDGCPETKYKDPASPGVKFRVGLVTGAYKDLAPRFGGISHTSLVTIDAHGLLSVSDSYRSDGSAFDFDPAYSNEDDQQIAGLKLRAAGVYRVGCSATIWSEDAPANATIGFTVLSNRAAPGEQPEDRINIEDLGDLPTGTGPAGDLPGINWGSLQSLPLYTSQKIDTQLYHTENEEAVIYERETQEKYRFKSQVGGHSFLSGYVGDSFVIANQTPYELRVTNLRLTVEAIPTRGNLTSFHERIFAGQSRSD